MAVHAHSIDPFNYVELKKDLRKYGLDIIEMKDWMDVLVLGKK
jgi:hypothetical protein